MHKCESEPITALQLHQGAHLLQATHDAVLLSTEAAIITSSVCEVGDEQRSEHKQVRDRLINPLCVNHPRCRRLLVLRHGQLHEAGEEEGREQQHVCLHGCH